MKTPADFATSPAMVALNTITSIAALAGAVNVMAVKAEATSATSPTLTNQNEVSSASINYDSATQKSTVLQYGGKATFTTTNTSSYQNGQTGYNTDDAKTTQD
jgi:hypothetical protein